MRYLGKDYVAAALAYEGRAARANAVGRDVLDFVRARPLDAEPDELLAWLGDRYEVDPAILDRDVARFLDSCIADGILVAIDALPLFGMDLSLTSQCNARCVYCPTPRLDRPRSVLDLADVDRLIDALLAPRLVETFGRLDAVELGGTAEPLLHPDILGVLGAFRRRYPTRTVVLYTNGLLLDPALSERLVAERLITSLVVSIDGRNDREHQDAKGIPLGPVATNLEAFLAHRDAHASQCQVVIQVLPWIRYQALVRRALAREPIRSPRVPPVATDDPTAEIIAAWAPRLGAADRIASAAGRFQLRGEDPLASEATPPPTAIPPCPWFDYVAHSLSIAANGDVLICCNDFAGENVLGNFLATDLYEILVGERRAFLRRLAIRRPHELPSRCRRSHVCQFLADEASTPETTS